ncbi:MAG TPA: 50S ribosomal protein L23 [Bacteroidales bacterium]|nr:50S ribosomal protein L23 [Bacteroidales bacterium]
MAGANDILIKPIITEKMTEAGEDLNQYGFVVHMKANKIQIRKAVEEMYGVTVEKVNTLRYRGKARSRYTRAGIIKGNENSFKKAVVTLTEGDSIDFYSNI